MLWTERVYHSSQLWNSRSTVLSDSSRVSCYSSYYFYGSSDDFRGSVDFSWSTTASSLREDSYILTVSSSDHSVSTSTFLDLIYLLHSSLYFYFYGGWSFYIFSFLSFLFSIKATPSFSTIIHSEWWSWLPECSFAPLFMEDGVLSTVLFVGWQS